VIALFKAASPLIREMLTVTPGRRANIEKICAHWWVNEGHTESCLDIAEELANQTPVRLDLLLSLAPPPPAVGSDMLLTEEQVIIPLYYFLYLFYFYSKQDNTNRNSGKIGIIGDRRCSEFDIGTGTWKHCTT
jgi:hypothetical protein